MRDEHDVLVAGTKARVGQAAVGCVPFLSRDVYEFDAVAEVGRHVFNAASERVG